MAIDFKEISGPKDSKQENFAFMCARLIKLAYPDAIAVDGRGGDEGLDMYIGKIDGELKVFQFKYFPDGLGRSQKAQIRRSLGTVLKKHKVKEWILVLPKDLNPHEIRWFEKLKKEYFPTILKWWGEIDISNLIPKDPRIVEEFFEKPLLEQILDNQKKELSGIGQILKAILPDREETKKVLDLINKNLSIVPTTKTKTHRDVKKDIAKDIKSRSRLSVLIWGPGEQGDPEFYRKRIQIRDRLKEMGHRAEFSEDILSADGLRAGGLNLKVNELIQARGFEYIVCLMASPGSIGEVHDFCTIEDIAHKMTICVDREHLSGYSGKGVLRIFEGLHGHLVAFDAEDIPSCRLLVRVVDQVEKRAEVKQNQIALSAGV